MTIITDKVTKKKWGRTLNKKLNRVLDEIQKTEGKIAVWQEHLRELNVLREQLEDQEIVKSVRSMRLDSRKMLEFLEGIQNGTITAGSSMEGSVTADVPGMAGEKQVPEETAPESEDCNEEN